MNKKINNFIKILSDYNTNENEVKYLEDKSINLQTEEGRIGFDLFLENDRRYKRSTYHIAINANANAVKTIEYVKKNSTDLFRIDSFIYLLRKKSKNSTIKNQIENLFIENTSYNIPKPNSIDYIGDIIKKISRNRSSIEFTPKSYILPKAFIETPSARELEYSITKQELTGTEKTISSEYILNWVNNSSKPILLILGKGGVGKTTIAEYISNLITDDNENVSNIFINSVHLKNRLNIEASQSTVSISLYDVYKHSINNQNILDEYYFGQNLDCNNFFIILDGIDELISKVGLFDIKSFIESIIYYNDDIKGLKVIITCRTEHWDYFTNENLQIVELKAFDKVQMENFFVKNFTKDSRDFNKAIAITSKFHKLKEESKEINIYHPYALELIVLLIKDKVNIEEFHTSLQSDRLNLNIDTDFIIANICAREAYLEGEPRVTDLTIDEQVKILEYIALFDGKLSISELPIAIEFGINKNIEREQNFNSQILAKSFISHPLLKVDGDLVSFAFDFHADIFKTTYFAHSLNIDNLNEEIKSEYLSFLSDFKFNSEIIQNICNRVNAWGDTQKLNIQELISIVEGSKNQDIRTQLLSGIFNFAFHLNSFFSKSGSQNKIENTNLIKDIYLNQNRIKNLVLLNIENQVYFDFSEVSVFENCVFNSYKSFWSTTNKWKSDVQFINCKFSNLGIRTTSEKLEWKVDKKYTNFDINSQKNMDEEFKDQFKERDDEKILKEEIEKHVKAFIHFFWRSGYFHSQNLDISTDSCITPLNVKYHKFSTIKLTIEDFLEVCKEFSFIDYGEYNKMITINVHKNHFWELKEYIQTNNKPVIVRKIESKLFEILT